MDTDEMLLVTSAEYRKLCDAAQRVYEEEFNTRMDATPPSLRRAIRNMVDVMEHSTAPGRLKVHRAAHVS
jgi:hypothetical protein